MFPTIDGCDALFFEEDTGGTVEVQSPMPLLCRGEDLYEIGLMGHKGGMDFLTDFISRRADGWAKPGQDLRRRAPHCIETRLNDALAKPPPATVERCDPRALPVAEQERQAVRREHCTHYGRVGAATSIRFWVMYRCDRVDHKVTMDLSEPDRLCGKGQMLQKPPPIDANIFLTISHMIRQIQAGIRRRASAAQAGGGPRSDPGWRRPVGLDP